MYSVFDVFFYYINLGNIYFSFFSHVFLYEIVYIFDDYVCFPVPESHFLVAENRSLISLVFLIAVNFCFLAVENGIYLDIFEIFGILYDN
jgi:hypothetical protein